MERLFSELTEKRFKKLRNRTVNSQQDARLFAEELEKAYEFLEEIEERVSQLENESE